MSESTTIDLPGREVASEAQSWPEKARAAVVTDAASYSRTAELLLGLKALRRRVAEVFDPHIRRAYEAHRALTREKSDAEAPLTEAEGIVKRALSDYDAACERQRREEQRRLDEEARRREEDERVAQAAAMETEGKEWGDDALVEEANALIEAPPVRVAAAPVAKATPKVSGITHREVWRFRITNPNLVPRKYLVVNKAAIRGVVNGLKGQTKIPGVEVYAERTVAAGR